MPLIKTPAKYIEDHSKVGAKIGRRSGYVLGALWGVSSFSAFTFWPVVITAGCVLGGGWAGEKIGKGAGMVTGWGHFKLADSNGKIAQGIAQRMTNLAEGVGKFVDTIWGRPYERVKSWMKMAVGLEEKKITPGDILKKWDEEAAKEAKKTAKKKASSDANRENTSETHQEESTIPDPSNSSTVNPTVSNPNPSHSNSSTVNPTASNPSPDPASSSAVDTTVPNSIPDPSSTSAVGGDGSKTPFDLDESHFNPDSEKIDIDFDLDSEEPIELELDPPIISDLENQLLEDLEKLGKKALNTNEEQPSRKRRAFNFGKKQVGRVTSFAERKFHKYLGSGKKGAKDKSQGPSKPIK